MKILKLVSASVVFASWTQAQNSISTEITQHAKQKILVTSSYSYIGTYTTLIIPTGVTSITVDISGAAAGNSAYSNCYCTGGYGARVTTTLAVSPGSIYYITIGGMGSSSEGGTGGYNGGGSAYQWGTGGGGASDIRLSTNTIAARVVVAGGGGGCVSYPWVNNGGVGGASGQIGYSGGLGWQSVPSGGGGTANAGGSSTIYTGYSTAGSLGLGGSSSTAFANIGYYEGGGGGGGGYYGGGGGA
eukprot:gene36425-44927_t